MNELTVCVTVAVVGLDIVRLETPSQAVTVAPEGTQGPEMGPPMTMEEVGRFPVRPVGEATAVMMALPGVNVPTQGTDCQPGMVCVSKM